MLLGHALQHVQNWRVVVSIGNTVLITGTYDFITMYQSPMHYNVGVNLCHSTNCLWCLIRAAELANSLDTPVCNLPSVPHTILFVQEYPLYAYGKSLYDIKEYRRAAHALRNAKSDEGFFLRCYSLFMVSTSVLRFTIILHGELRLVKRPKKTMKWRYQVCNGGTMITAVSVRIRWRGANQQSWAFDTQARASR